MDSQLRERVSREGLPVELHGLTGRAELAQALVSARALVLPSVWYENCPMSLIEAGAAAIPAIASSIGGIPEVVSHGETGLLTAPSDPDALASAIDALAADDAFAASLGDAARARVVARHHPDVYREAILDAYRRAGAVASVPAPPVLVA
jgi:glycosyltransferase involved in cell wall biosynthesis